MKPCPSPLLVALAVAACASPPPTPAVPAPELHLLASPATGPLARSAAAAFARQNGIRFELAQVGQAELIESLASTPQALGIRLSPSAADGLWSTPIAWDALAVVVNPANPVAGLSLEAVSQIFRGRATDWAAAGGEGEIHLVVREAGTDVRTAFDGLALQGAAPSLNSLVAPSAEAMLEAVAADPAAVGYALLSQIGDGVRAVPLNGVRPTRAAIEAGRYLLAVPVLAVAAAEPEGRTRQFVFWLQSPEGQALVGETHARLVSP